MGEPKRHAMVPPRSGSSSETRDSVTISVAAVGTWTMIQDRLTPIIGEDGFRVLFARSLHRARVRYPWLSRDPGTGDSPFAVLQASLASRTPEQAAAGHLALVENFHQLLGALIGNELAERLIGPLRVQGDPHA